MTLSPSRRTEPLSVDAIVDAACALLDAVGLAGLSMRKLGTALGVDPMAVYHHVRGKRELLGLVMARIVGRMPALDERAPWDARVRAWATAYREIVIAYPDLVATGIADPVVAEGGIPQVRPLADALAASGLPAHLVEPIVYLVVDFVHGAALGAASQLRSERRDPAPLRAAFDIGLDTILAGVGSSADDAG
jgi:AcrR family transcriptional regulator